MHATKKKCVKTMSYEREPVKNLGNIEYNY
jgi:hypothetical protein